MCGRARAGLCCAVFAAMLLPLSGCRADDRVSELDPEQVAACMTVLDETGGTILIGTKGGEELCGCIVLRIEARLPDAATRWETFAGEVEDRFGRRGLLGMIADSSWLFRQAGAMGELGSAYVEALGHCQEEMIRSWSDDDSGQPQHP
jgi:hypothetical protein